MPIRRWTSRVAAAAVCALATSAAAQDASVTPARHQLSVEAGYLETGITYAQRLGTSRWSAGGGVWGAWEPANSFSHDLFEPVGVQAFARYQPVDWFHGDLGLALARYAWADDCSDCGGTLTGVRAAALFGRGVVFAGPQLTAGWTHDTPNGTEFGLVYGAQLRILLGWPRRR